VPEFRVIWEIDIDAETPREAAHKALLIQRKHDGIATVFRIGNEEFDLSEDDSGLEGIF
jgi:hypothetical protein